MKCKQCHVRAPVSTSTYVRARAGCGMVTSPPRDFNISYFRSWGRVKVVNPEVEMLGVAVVVDVDPETVVTGEREVREVVVAVVVEATSGLLDAMSGVTGLFTGGLRFFLRVVLCLMPGIVTEMSERRESSQSWKSAKKDDRFLTHDVTYVTVVAPVNIESHWSFSASTSRCRQHQRIFIKNSTYFYVHSIQSVAADLSRGQSAKRECFLIIRVKI